MEDVALRAEDQAFVDSIGPVPYDWTEPATITMLGDDAPRTGLVCRLCIARIGIKGTERTRLLSREQFETHMRSEHVA